METILKDIRFGGRMLVKNPLGAQTRDVVSLVLKQGLVQLGIGLTAGFGLAALLSNMMEIVLFRVQPMDITIFLTIPLVLIVTGLLACLRAGPPSNSRRSDGGPTIRLARL